MKKLLTIISLAALLHCPAAFAGSPAFDEAVQHYKARRYAQALSGFQSILKSNPSDAMAHYYMALCFLSLNQISQARSQYEWVTNNSGNAQLIGFANTGMAQLSKYQSSFRSYTPVPPAGSHTGPAQAPAPPKISGRLKILEFYADW